jgi:DNA-binding NarL/FixJ family response regulator
MRILVVDDHPLMRNAIRTALETLMDTVEIEFAGSLEDAFRLSRAAEQDLVLLDLNLPDAHGSATIGAYCHRLPGKRVVAISGDDDPRTIRACQSAGAVGFLSKTYGMRRTVGTIRKVLAGEAAFPDPEAQPGRPPGAWQQEQRYVSERSAATEPTIAGASARPSGDGPMPSEASAGTATGAHSPAGWTTPVPPRAAALSPTMAVTPHPDGRHLGLTERQRQVLRLMLRGLPNKLICRELSLAEGTVKVHVSAVLRALNVANRAQVVVAATRAGIHLE